MYKLGIIMTHFLSLLILKPQEENSFVLCIWAIFRVPSLILRKSLSLNTSC